MRWLMFAFLVTVTVAFTGCKQGEGDRCQVQSDCDDGFICVLAVQGTPQSGGTCQKPGSASTDLAVQQNLDLSADLSETPADL